MSEKNLVYKIEPATLSGSVSLGGAKNSGLRLLAASLLTGDEIRLESFPVGLRDSQVHIEMLEALGKETVVRGKTVAIAEKRGMETTLDWQGRSIRNTLLVLGALVARFGEARVPAPGGCQIGDRKIDLHEKLLTAMGATVTIEDGFLVAKSAGRLKGAELTFHIRSTGATENALIAGSLADGRTIIHNPHITPEVRDLIKMIETMGAEVNVYGTETLEIIGARELSGATMTVRPDRIEAITWLVGALITKGEVEIGNFPFDDLTVPLAYLEAAGARFYRSKDSMLVRQDWCSPIEISTGSHPSIHSDMQPMFGVYATTTNGTSTIVDLRYPERFQYAEELNNMGANCVIEHGKVTITGPSSLHGATVAAADLRAGAALALAGLVAEGETTLQSAWQLERGYEDFVEKINALGANIRREDATA
jgi:UDP-N-acetylglucosamine 1-carboxyvinyltransferase